MDFRLTQEKLESGKLEQEELFEQIKNLPCMYGLLESESQIFCLDLENQATDEVITILPVFSSFELALEALEKFQIIPGEYAESYIAHWTDINDATQLYDELKLDGVGLDLLPDGKGMTGIILEDQAIEALK